MKKKLSEKHQQREAGAGSPLQGLRGGEGGGRFPPSKKRPLTLRQDPGLPRRSSAPCRPPAPPLRRWQTRRGAGGRWGKRGSAVPRKGSQGPVLPLCGEGAPQVSQPTPPFPRKRPDFPGGAAVPSRGGAIYYRGWGQRKPPTEGKGTGELHLRGRGRSRLPLFRPQTLGLRAGLRGEAPLLCPPGPRTEMRVPGGGQSLRAGGISASALPCPPGCEELGRRHCALPSPGHGSHPRRGGRRPLPLMRFFEIQKSEF